MEKKTDRKNKELRTQRDKDTHTQTYTQTDTERDIYIHRYTEEKKIVAIQTKIKQ